MFCAVHHASLDFEKNETRDGRETAAEWDKAIAGGAVLVAG
jgi:hypothetical protein